MSSTPRFLQGVFPFEGKGLTAPYLVDEALGFTVPAGAIAQPLYFRGGHTGDALVVVSLYRDGTVMRHFAIGANQGVNIPLRVVEDVDPDSRLELRVAAPVGCVGELVIDFGLVLV
ncbi:molybdopterin oxidoreductase [Hoyosella rhizosphaerae]|nr:molybdopterin oxidoreductase [Hoyosella rhizosphaerae]MBN4925469.1 molybdopterin oxidoreductase [Hoyosella rhizosphaerae]